MKLCISSTKNDMEASVDPRSEGVNIFCSSIQER
jgi:hypothetical protein